MIDLSDTIPTMLSEQMRAASAVAMRRAIDPLNKMDDNPYIGQEWIVVASLLWNSAATLDKRLSSIFSTGGTDP